MEKTGRCQIAAIVIRMYEAIWHIDQNSEAAGEYHQLACNLLVAELWWFASRHAT